MQDPRISHHRHQGGKSVILLRAGNSTVGVKGGKTWNRFQERGNVLFLLVLVSVILNPVTLLDLHSFSPVLFFVANRPSIYETTTTTITEHYRNRRLEIALYFCFFNQAVEVAELQDRIHLRTTYYNYAKHLESTGNISAAIVKWVGKSKIKKETPLIGRQEILEGVRCSE